MNTESFNYLCTFILHFIAKVGSFITMKLDRTEMMFIYASLYFIKCSVYENSCCLYRLQRTRKTLINRSDISRRFRIKYKAHIIRIQVFNLENIVLITHATNLNLQSSHS